MEKMGEEVQVHRMLNEEASRNRTKEVWDEQEEKTTIEGLLKKYLWCGGPQWLHLGKLWVRWTRLPCLSARIRGCDDAHLTSTRECARQKKIQVC
jgi:hypothetical protein